MECLRLLLFLTQITQKNQGNVSYLGNKKNVGKKNPGTHKNVSATHKLVPGPVLGNQQSTVYVVLTTEV